jgi:hypothetical protein
VVENRERYGELQNSAILKKTLKERKDANKRDKFNDFHVLIYLCKFLDVGTTEAIAECIKNRSDLGEGLDLILSDLLH